MQKNNEIKSKKIRSTSARSKEQKNIPNNFNQSEKENTNIENNNNTISNNKKGLHHRKRTSSYFLGSYIPSSNILESNQEKDDDDININLNINNNLYNNLNENSKDKDEDISNEIKNKLIYNLINNDSNNNISFSFPSYDESNPNNSLIIKQQNSSNKKSNNKSNKKNDNYNRNNIYYEMAKDAENSSNCKSFISFKNTLKYIKDKDERTTPSYLLALQTDKKNGNNNYVTSSNIIEEEKSSMMESKSEYSNKKEMFHFEKKSLQDNTNEKNNYILEDIGGDNKDNKDNVDNANNETVINNNMNLKNYKDKNRMKKQISDNNSIQDESNKISSALNEIIIKNNKKEENRRKYLTKNKMTLLNTFFTMSKTLPTNKEKIDSKIKIENYKNDKDKGINKIVEIKESNNLNYYMKRKYINKVLKKSFTNKRVIDPHMNMEGQYLNSMNNLNNNMKLNASERYTINSQFNHDNNTNNDENDENINLKKNLNKIPHLTNVKNKFQRKLMNDSSSNLIDTPFRKLKTTNSNNNSSSRKNSLKNVKNDRNFQTLKRLENLNNALSFIREKKKIIKSNTNIDKKKYNKSIYNYSNGNNSNLNNKPNGHSNSFKEGK